MFWNIDLGLAEGNKVPTEKNDECLEALKKIACQLASTGERLISLNVLAECISDDVSTIAENKRSFGKDEEDEGEEKTTPAVVSFVADAVNQGCDPNLSMLCSTLVHLVGNDHEQTEALSEAVHGLGLAIWKAVCHIYPDVHEDEDEDDDADEDCDDKE